MAKDQSESEMHAKQDDLQQTHSMLDAANAYHDTLKPSCVEVQVSWDERAAQRKDEIEALDRPLELNVESRT